MTPKISAIIHTKNEEKNIENCLKSLLWVDEILLIDEESEDKTVSLAKKYTNNVFSMPSKGIVEYNRNEGLKLAKNDWILVMDADELVPYKLAQELQKIALQDSADIVWIPRCNFSFGIRTNHKNPDYQLRFFKKNQINYQKKIHAYPEYKKEAKSLKLKNFDLSILHLSNQTVEGWQEKANRYSSTKAKELFEEDRPFSLLNLFAISFKTAIRELLLDRKLFYGFNGLLFTFQSIYDHYLTYMKLKLMRKYQNVNYQDSILDHYNKMAKAIHQTHLFPGEPYGQDRH